MKTSMLQVSTFIAAAGLSIPAFAAQPTIPWNISDGHAYKWTGGAGDNKFETAGNWVSGSVSGTSFSWSETNIAPSRDNNKGFILYFEGNGQTVNVAGGRDTSDGGGIVVTGTGNTVTATLGGWGGNVQVDVGNILNASWTHNLKDGHIIANGTVNLTGNLNLDGKGQRAWYVGSEGKINSTAVGLSTGTIVVSGEINNANAGESLDGLTNRALGIGVKSKELVSFSNGLATGLASLSVGEISGTTGESALASVDSRDALTTTGQYYAATSSSGVTVYYTVDGMITKETLTWTGSSDGNWVAGGTNWNNGSGNSTSFVNGDDVIFTSASSTKTVTLANGASLSTGTATIESGTTYTFVVGSGSTTLSGTTLTVASGAKLIVGSGDSKTVNLAYDKISLAGTLEYNNGASTWSTLEFSNTGANLHIEDLSGTGLTISNMIVSQNATITANWGTTLSLGTLSGTGNLEVQGTTKAEAMALNIGSFGDYSGTMTFTKKTGNFAVKITGQTSGKTASIVIGNGITTEISPAGLVALNEISVKSNATLLLSSSGGKLDYNTLTLDNGAVFRFQNGHPDGAQIGSADSKLVINAAGGTATIAGSYFGNSSNIQGNVLGAGTVKFTSGNKVGGSGDNNYIVSAKISDGESMGDKLAVLIDLNKKTPSASVTFSGANTYSGGTKITSGTLIASNASALGSGSVSIDSGAKLEASTAVTLNGDLTLKLSGAGILSSGSEFVTSSGAGTVTLSEGVVVYVDISSLTLSEADEFALYLATANALAAESNDFRLGQWNADSSIWTDSEDWFVGSYDSVSGILNITNTPIPEPSTFSLLAGLGVIAMVVSRRRKKLS